MIVVLNGPLGIGKSTLAELLTESIDSCVHLDGDALVAVQPAPEDPIELLHSSLAVLLPHYRAAGYRHFIISHIWKTAAELEALKSAVAPQDGADVSVFLLTLPLEDNLRRVAARQRARAADETEFEMETLREERESLYSGSSGSLGHPFDVSGSPTELVTELRRRLGF